MRLYFDPTAFIIDHSTLFTTVTAVLIIGLVAITLAAALVALAIKFRL